METCWRAISVALINTECWHWLLWLLTAYEIIEHPEYYDIDHDNYCGVPNDVRLALTNYKELLAAAVQDTRCEGYASMMHLYAISGAILPIWSYFPGANISRNPMAQLYTVHCWVKCLWY